MHLAPANVFLFGPPGSGKTTVGVALAGCLGRTFVDTDDLVAERAGKEVELIFAEDGEAAFRSLEVEICRTLPGRSDLVVACGGGSLLNDEIRAAFERSGTVFCLRCSTDELEARLQNAVPRPLLAGGGNKLNTLIEGRRSLYDSFPLQIDTTSVSVDAVVDQIQQRLKAPSASALPVRQSPGYEIHLGSGLLPRLSELAEEAGLRAPFVIVADEAVDRLYGDQVGKALGAPRVKVPSGETSKTLEMAGRLYASFLEFGLERSGSVVALGGGMVGDLAGFAAATYMRGVKWMAVPTTLLAMVDASIGGKVGVDLPQGKNLAGAFHLPARVVADTDTLETLPVEDFRAGMAELLKAALIADPELLEWIEAGGGRPTTVWIARAMAVKIAIVEADPFEGGERAKLNLGHTIGHGVEASSDYSLRHGEAVSIGMMGEAMLAEALGLSAEGLSRRVRRALEALGLPSAYPGLDPEAVRKAMQADKKRAGGRLQFALLAAPGDVRIGVEAPEGVLMDVLERLRGGS